MRNFVFVLSSGVGVIGNIFWKFIIIMFVGLRFLYELKNYFVFEECYI